MLLKIKNDHGNSCISPSSRAAVPVFRKEEKLIALVV